MNSIDTPCIHPALKTVSLSQICERGHAICMGFGEELVGSSGNLRLEKGSDCYWVVNEADTLVAQIVPRLVEDEIWYGVPEPLGDETISLEPRGAWCIENTPYTFYNIDSNKYI